MRLLESARFLRIGSRLESESVTLYNIVIILSKIEGDFKGISWVSKIVTPWERTSLRREVASWGWRLTRDMKIQKFSPALMTDGEGRAEGNFG